MYNLKKIGHIMNDRTIDSTLCKSSQFVQITYDSKLWKIWYALITPRTCYYCLSMHGKILAIDDQRILGIPVHRNCNCHTEAVTAIAAGTVTSAGSNGIDLYVALNGHLPENYLTQFQAKQLGWKKLLGNLAEVLPGKIIGGDVYKNRDHRLPDAVGRIWYEADFDYISGFRNGCRLLYSNDGLLFATYDHYLTFCEVGLENIK